MRHPPSLRSLLCLFRASNTMRVVVVSVALLLLLASHGVCFTGNARYGSLPRRCFASLHKNHVSACTASSSILPRRHSRSEHHRASPLDDTDELLFERMDSDQWNVMDWSILRAVLSINLFLLWFLLAHESPTVEMQDTTNNGHQEIIQPRKDAMYEEDVTVWMDSSAGFFFY